MADVRWTISGDDAALFTIDPDSGKLVLPEQNYEEPADQDEDNVYEVTVRATDEDGNARSQDIEVTVSDVTLGTFVVSVSECCSDDNARKVYGADEGAEILVLITATAEGSSAPMSIKLATASHDDGAHLAESDDYTATSPATFTWTETHLVLAKQDPARTKYFSFKVSTTQDNVLEEHETFMIVLSEGTAAGTDDVDFRFTSQSQNVISIDGNSAQAVVTIANDDVADLSIADATAVEGKDAWFKINLGAVLDKDITVKWATSDDTTKDAAQATAGTDYKARTKAQTATITAGETTTRVRVKTKDDELDEDDETFMVVLSEPNSATLSADAIAIGTITDNDPVPQLSVADALVAEGGKAQFTVTLDPVSGRDVTVQWTTGDDPAQDAVQATAGDDYTAVSSAQTVTIKAGQARATIEVQTTDDELDEGDETFIVTLASPANAALAANPSATGTITDTDRTPELSVDDVTVKEGGKASFTVTLTSTPSQDVTVQWTTSDDTAQNAHSATADIDYTAAANAQTLTIKAGKRSAAIEVQTTQDALDEEDETFLVTLASPTNATLSADPSGKATISDDDDPPTASVRDAADVTEGDDPAVTTNMTFPVHLSAVSGKQVTVQYTLAGTATAGADYTDPATKSVTIAAGSQTADILIPIKGDEIDEPNEIIELTLSAPTNATLPQPADAEEELETSSQGGVEGGEGEDQSPSQEAESATASGTITDDDAVPTAATLTVSPTSVTENGGAKTITVTATLGGTTTFAADKSIAVKVGKSTDTAKSADDYTAVADQTLTIAAGSETGTKTFTLTPTNDALDEDNESLTVHGVSTGLTFTPATVSITDDDATPTVSVADATAVTEGNDPKVTADMSFTVSLSAVSGRAVTVNYTLGGTAAAGDDYTAPNPLSVTIAAGERTGKIVIPVKGDVVDEPNETVEVTLTGASNASLSSTEGDTEASGTITDDDDSLPALTIADATGKEGKQVVFTVSVTPVSSKRVTFSWTTSDNATQGVVQATAGGDYTAVTTATTATIRAGKRSVKIRVATTQDALDEQDETFAVTLSAPANAELGSDRTGVGTIRDDDPLPTVSVADAAAVDEGDDPAVTTDMTFTVTLSEVSGRDVTVGYRLGGTARAAFDYVDPAQKRVTIAAGQQTAEIVIAVKGDLADEPNEVVKLTLENPRQAKLGGRTARGVITDDDERAPYTGPTADVIIEADQLSIEGGSLAFTIRLSRALDHDVRVPVRIEQKHDGIHWPIEATEPHTGTTTYGVPPQEVKLLGRHDPSPGQGDGYYMHPAYAEPVVLTKHKVYLAPVIRAGRTMSLGLMTAHRDRDQDHEQFAIVLDDDHKDWPQSLLVSDGTKAAVPMIIDAQFAPAARWWDVLSRDGRRTLTAGADDHRVSTSQPHLFDRSYAKVNTSFQEVIGRLAWLLTVPEDDPSNSDNPGTAALVNDTDMEFRDWWAGLDCAGRRTAMGEGTSDDSTSRWCKDLPPEEGDDDLASSLSETDVHYVTCVYNAFVGGSEPECQNTATLAVAPTSIAENRGATEITITLASALPSGQSLTLPLKIAGGTVGEDYTLALKSGDGLNTAVTLRTTAPYSEQEPAVELSAGAQVATLQLTALDDDETDARSLTVGYSTHPLPTDTIQPVRQRLTLVGGPFTVTLENDDVEEEVEGGPDPEDKDPDLTPPDVSITIVASGAATEGDAVKFTIIATPAPAAALTVNLTVSQTGDFLAAGASGVKSVVIPTSGSATHSVATVDDRVEEADGSVTAKLKSGDGYTISDELGSATKTILDDDGVPELSVTAGPKVTEGESLSFTITAEPKPSAALTVSFTISESGCFLAADDLGAQTVTIPMSGTATYTIATIDNDLVEWGGTVTLTLKAGSGYTVSSMKASADASIDNNDELPEGQL
ncbi:MAG: hypothetical protein OXG12_09535, partial [Cyanobacteria bacterium MAG COS4_bin_21]|nr:hypothetical protein [Cyanobacteria bacterium MAG COS4_bin_21]